MNLNEFSETAKRMCEERGNKTPIEQTAEQKAETMGEKVAFALKGTIRTDDPYLTSSAKVKAIVLSELNLAELVKCKERCEALEYDNVEIAKNAAQIRARLDEAMAENSILRRQNDMTGTILEGVTKERDSLRAKVQELEKELSEIKSSAEKVATAFKEHANEQANKW